MFTPAIRLLQSFTTWPVPGPPTRTTTEPSAPSRGSTRANASSEPPTKTLSVPASAPIGPPLTGASSESMPAAPSSSASRRASAGGPVDMSTNVATPEPGEAARHRLDRLRRRQRRDRDLGGSAPSAPPSASHPRRVEVVTHHLVPRGDQVPRHRQAHRPEAVERDPRHVALTGASTGSLPKNVFETA